MKKSFLFLTYSLCVVSTSSIFADESFAKYDSNRDGVAEYRELATEKKKNEFDKMDRNRDKSVSEAEYAAVPIVKSGDWDLFATPDFKTLDADGNGSVSLAEFGAAVKSILERIDSNKTGSVTAEVYATAVQKSKEAAAAATASQAPKGSAPKGSTPKKP